MEIAEFRLSVGIASVSVCHIIYFHAISRIVDWCAGPLPLPISRLERMAPSPLPRAIPRPLPVVAEEDSAALKSIPLAAVKRPHTNQKSSV